MASTASSTMKVSGRRKGRGSKESEYFVLVLVPGGADLEGSLAKLFKAVHAASRTYPRKTFWQV